jgi:hypothetical protein
MTNWKNFKKECHFCGFICGYTSWHAKQISYCNKILAVFSWIMGGLKTKFKYVYKSINVITLNLFVFPHWRWRYGQQWKWPCEYFTDLGFALRIQLLMAGIKKKKTVVTVEVLNMGAKYCSQYWKENFLLYQIYNSRIRISPKRQWQCVAKDLSRKQFS